MIKRLLFTAAALLSLFLAQPQAILAKDLFNGVDCGKAQASAVCTEKTSSDPLTGKDGALAHATNVVSFVAGAAAIIMIMVSALRFVTSGSDISTNSRTDTDVENARHTLFNAVVGLAIIALSRGIILFVLSKT
jgi:hypothetical protein